MRNSAVRAIARTEAAPAEAAPAHAAAAGPLSIGRIVAVTPAADGGPARVTLQRGAAAVEAEIDPAVDLAVLVTAHATGEAVLVVESEGRPTVVGALRTRATPGVDAVENLELRARTVSVEAESFAVRAGKVALAADEELSLRARTAFIALRAAGEIESFAERIVTRAEGVHKLVGRMLRLN